MVTLMHRNLNRIYQVKKTNCGHSMMRDVFRGAGGVTASDWRRTKSATLDQLRRECNPIPNPLS